MKKLRILVPTDFSEFSTNAFPHAQALAESINGQITIFNAYKTGSPAAATIDDDPNSERNRKMYDIASRQINPKYIEACVSQLAEPVEAIVEKSKDFDLIVMASHGRTGFSRLMLGSVTEKVIRYSEIPVLVVENAEPLIPMKRILLTTDFSDNAYKAYRFAHEFAASTGAEIDLYYILSYDITEPATQIEAFKRTKEKQLNKDINELFSGISDRVHGKVVLTKKSIHEKLTAILNEEDYNIAIMATLGRTGLEYLRLGSTTANVVRHVETPVLVVNPKASQYWTD